MGGPKLSGGQTAPENTGFFLGKIVTEFENRLDEISIFSLNDIGA
jgi:hypothetical protein